MFAAKVLESIEGTEWGTMAKTGVMTAAIGMMIILGGLGMCIGAMFVDDMSYSVGFGLSFPQAVLANSCLAMIDAIGAMCLPLCMSVVGAVKLVMLFCHIVLLFAGWASAFHAKWGGDFMHVVFAVYYLCGVLYHLGGIIVFRCECGRGEDE